MARVFTTEFIFKGENYTAVICKLDAVVSIYLPDETLHQILPSGKAKFSPGTGLFVDTPKSSLAQQLLLTVLTSIEVEKTL